VVKKAAEIEISTLKFEFNASNLAEFAILTNSILADEGRAAQL
jgi:hypothetical protein